MKRRSLEEILEKNLQETDLREARKLLYGCDPETIALPSYKGKYHLEVKGFKLNGALREQLRPPRVVRIGVIQHAMDKSVSDPIQEQREAVYEKISGYIEHAAACGVNILCLQEIWSVPYNFCAREIYPTCEFAEDAETGPTVKLISKLAQVHNMVIVCPILERDDAHGETIYNTAVVINADGSIIGKHRKNHIPRMSYNESNFYESGNLGHPVFETQFGKIGIVICFARLHPLNWLMQGINGAEIVFCPSAAIGDVEESYWSITGRCEALTNSFFTASLNRVGTEKQSVFTMGDGTPPRTEFGEFFGSSYVASPSGTRTPGLSRNKDGLLVTEIDLNECRQAKDIWSLRMTQRLDHYIPLLVDAIKEDFTPHVIKK